MRFLSSLARLLGLLGRYGLRHPSAIALTIGVPCALVGFNNVCFFISGVWVLALAMYFIRRVYYFSASTRSIRLGKNNADSRG